MMLRRLAYSSLPFLALFLVLAAASSATEATSKPVGANPATPPPASQVGSVVISAVTIGGAGGALSITNLGGAPADLSGWYVCNFPAYWPIPSRMLGAGESLTIHGGSGTDTATDLFAGGGFGSFGATGEVALYRDADFDAANSIVAYVAWNGGKERKSVAQAAGIWGDADVSAAVGDTIVRTGSAADASAYTVAVDGLPATGSGGLADGGRSAAGLWAVVVAAIVIGLLGTRRALRR
ncbi:MAG: lamin tail domain-containing protein [Chloroflexi bacterium]|nr:lamin tail domain-containing protein [Chloroflexota bacterium]